MEDLKRQLCFNIKNSIIHTVDTEDQCYVMDISVTPSLLAAAGSNFLIKVYDRSNNSIVNILNGHKDRINEIRFIENTNTLLSCSEDKTVRIWDCKTGQSTSINQQDEIYSFDLNGEILAMGVGSTVVLYNISTKKLIRKFEESHTQDVTRVRFHPVDKNKLISCSVDGLICMYDLEQQDDDDAIIQVINAEDSIGEIGFFGDQYQYLYSLSHTEKLTLWDLVSGNKIKHFNEIRTVLSERYGYQINYLVTCLYDKSSNQLILFAGDFEGTGYVFLVTNDDVIEISKLPSVHTDVLRNVYWDKFKSELITSAEDSKIAFWVSSNNNNLTNSNSNKMV
ncbi:hypothetical protein DICPUDRAFT_76622 [Dictyostelium purpureum]|uniref:Uncharacterized protein n=1 Tax=Dictyostelium purpureum TaxID=5786 RepID=F0ZE71_DICPU|nr:uncharacterized protein DICPUDRAFT_76622 [Dictyostelium purpureum]EGC37774.1 hypothetical protein DICPUDRAFT_76622 [Dictyostelium purpureum]|eukprot:XP_003285713.1 hypothetical protein DICPUDRAFT_76622 [Dictyostelium purpureum]